MITVASGKMVCSVYQPGNKSEGETMRTLIQPSFVIILFVLVRAADLAIGAAIGRALIQAVAYGLVAILALLAVLLVPLGL